jgi:flavin reductase (DIM6/NTAB) family NADH-FMN oxidoreductase RutF
MIVDPSGAGPVEVYRLMTGAIVPRPIAFVSTVNESGVFNLAPFSFFTGISANPPVICFCPMIRGDGTRKDTLRNIEATREFVVNVVSEEIGEKMNLTAPEYPPDVDEFEVSGLTPVPSDLVRAPRVKESHVNMECRLVHVVDVSLRPLGGSIVIGEIVRFHVDDSMVANYMIDPDKLRPIGRMSGPTYTRTTDRFDMSRPAARRT